MEQSSGAGREAVHSHCILLIGFNQMFQQVSITAALQLTFIYLFRSCVKMRKSLNY